MNQDHLYISAPLPGRVQTRPRKLPRNRRAPQNGFRVCNDSVSILQKLDLSRTEGFQTICSYAR